MKQKYFYLTFSIWIVSVFSQEKNAYFPLDLGNEWVYFYKAGLMAFDYDSFSVTILDTHKVNGIVFYEFSDYNWFSCHVYPALFAINNDTIYFYDVNHDSIGVFVVLSQTAIDTTTIFYKDPLGGRLNCLKIYAIYNSLDSTFRIMNFTGDLTCSGYGLWQCIIDMTIKKDIGIISYLAPGDPQGYIDLTHAIIDGRYILYRNIPTQLKNKTFNQIKNIYKE